MRLAQLTACMVAVVVVTLSGLAHACSCGRVGDDRPCTDLSTSNPVVVAKVLTVEPVAEADGHIRAWHDWRMRIVVEEVFRGHLPSEVEVTTGLGGGDCGERLEPNQRYLLHLYSSSGGYRISICSGDRLVERIDDPWLVSIRKLATSKSGSIYGAVRKTTRNIKNDELSPASPLASMRVTARSGERTETTRTDDLGKYEFASLPPGKYQLEVELPQNYSHYYDLPENHEIAVYSGGCTYASVLAMANGHIGGRVLGRDGLPVSGLSVTLLPADDSEPDEFDGVQSLTNDAGEFEFKFVPSGTYIVGVNLTWIPDSQEGLPTIYLPGSQQRAAATEVKLAEGETAKGLEMHVPFTAENLKRQE